MRRALCLALIAAMESCYLYALLAFLVALTQSPHALTPLPVFAAYWLALAVGRVFAPAKRPMARPVFAVTAFALVTMLAVVYFELYTRYAWYDAEWLAHYLAAWWRLRSSVAEIIVSLGVLYIVIRGIGLARRPLSLWYVGLLFRIGVVVFFVVFIAASILEAYDVSVWLVAYFGFALIALALARIEEVAGDVRLGPRWGATLLGAAALVLLLGLLLAQFFTFETARIFWLLLAPIGMALGLLLVLFAIPAGYIAEWLVNLLKPTLTQFGQMLEGLQNLALLDSEVGEPARESVPTLPFLEPLFRTALMLMALLVVGRLIARALDRRLRQIEENTYAREALGWDDDAARVALDSPKPRAPRPRVRHIAAETIRRMYAALVARAAAAGLPRRIAETPYEFLPRLAQTFPEHTDDLRAITEAYVAVHYGELDAPVEQVNRVRAAWRRVEQALRTQKTIPPET